MALAGPLDPAEQRVVPDRKGSRYPPSRDILMIPNYRKLREMDDDALVEHYNALAKHTVAGTGVCLHELVRRQVSRDSARMLGMTRHMMRLTWFIAALTVVNVFALFAGWFNAGPG